MPAPPSLPPPRPAILDHRLSAHLRISPRSTLLFDTSEEKFVQLQLKAVREGNGGEGGRETRGGREEIEWEREERGEGMVGRDRQRQSDRG